MATLLRAQLSSQHDIADSEWLAVHHPEHQKLWSPGSEGPQKGFSKEWTATSNVPTFLPLARDSTLIGTLPPQLAFEKISACIHMVGVGLFLWRLRHSHKLAMAVDLDVQALHVGNLRDTWVSLC